MSNPAARSSSSGAAAPKEIRELLCMVCDRDYPVWFAPNDLWNPIMRRADGSDEYPFICPTCFGNVAAGRGVQGPFMLVAGEPVNLAGRLSDSEHERDVAREALKVVASEVDDFGAYFSCASDGEDVGANAIWRLRSVLPAVLRRARSSSPEKP